MKNATKTSRWLGRAALLLTLNACTSVQAQSIACDNYNFTSAAGWTQVNTKVSITGGAIDYATAPDGYLPHYVYTTLGTALGNSWTCDFEFTPTSGSGPSHTLVSFTESNAGTVENAHGYRSSAGGTMNYMRTNCIEALLIGPANATATTNWVVRAQCKVRTGGAYGTTTTTPITWSYISSGITLGTGALNTTFYGRLQRLDATNGMLSLFSDAARTTLIDSKCFSIDAAITNLDAIQSGNCPEGATHRNFSGTVDNISVCNLNPSILGPSPVCVSGSAENYQMWNGNSNVTSSNCGFPGATSFTWSAPAGSTFPSGTGGTCSSGGIGVFNECPIDVNTSGNVTCTVQYSCGTTLTYSLSVAVETTPVSVITGSSSFCSSSPTIALDGTSSTGETAYRWGAIESDASGNPVGSLWCTPATFTSGTAGPVNILAELASCSFVCGNYYNIRLEVVNSCTRVVSYHVIFIDCGCRTSQNSTQEHTSATVYPNPATKQITVQTAVIPDQLFITDALGRQVMGVQPVSEQTQVNVSGLSPGIYFVNIVTGEAIKTERLVIEE